MNVPAKIMLVDDDPQIRIVFNRALTRAGFRVVECSDGSEAVERVPREAPALIILDVDMPRLNGWKTLAELRRQVNTPPVLMLAHMSDLASRVRGLDAGADDYLGKPCDVAELVARVRALLRRTQPRTASGRLLQFGDLVVDLEQKTASRGGTPVRFTRTEYALLDLFRDHAGKPVSRDLMLERLWGSHSGNSHTVDTHLWRLRRKLGDTGENPRWLQNFPGIGYRLTWDAVDTTPPGS
jgi:two-component system response regulator MprA